MLECIDMPPSVRVIKDHAFRNCLKLATAILNDGLEEIGEGAFKGCALVHIDIPPSVMEIHDTAFKKLLQVDDCSVLRRD